MSGEISHIVVFLVFIGIVQLSTTDHMRACFFHSQSRLRPDEINAIFSVKDIDFSLCTHYVYGSAKIDTEQQTIMPANREEEEGRSGLFQQFRDGKSTTHDAKTVLTLGGAEDDTDFAFKRLHSKNDTFGTFAEHAIGFLRDKGFDGLNIHWEVKDEEMGKEVLPKLLQALRNAFDGDQVASKLLLIVTGFVVPHSIDFFLRCGENIQNASISKWRIYGTPYNKMVLGVTALGNYVYLKDPLRHDPGAPIEPKILRGSRYNIPNRLAYPEVCQMMRTSRKVYDNVQKSPYLVAGHLWVGYTNTVSLAERIQFMKGLGLGGIIFYSLDEDDFSGTACNFGKFPLVTFIRDTLDPINETAPDGIEPGSSKGENSEASNNDTHRRGAYVYNSVDVCRRINRWFFQLALCFSLATLG